MKQFWSILACVLLFCSCATKDANTSSENTYGPITLVIHGGAGTIVRENMPPEKEQLYHARLKEALDSGYAVLDRGGKSIDAVVAAIRIMEDSPLFNAGKGAVFTHEETNEMDASIMDGHTLAAGAVAGITTVKNPIAAAYAVMTKSEHVMLTGHGAETFAEECGLEMVEPSYFFDSTRYKQLIRSREKTTAAASSADDYKYGTVGAVALDRHGHIAAGTSTGGITNKRFGRVGDSPIIGAGTYANDMTCGISSTGKGEFFIRSVVAYDISALMQYGGLSLQQAADSVIMKKLKTMGGDGGVVGLDRQGNIIMTFNTPGMYRGFIQEKGSARTFIYRD